MSGRDNSSDHLDGPALEVICVRCEGRGGEESKGGYGFDWVRCCYCNGAGYIPTTLGEQILALMRHNFRPMLEDATGE